MVGELPKAGGGSVKIRYELCKVKKVYLDEQIFSNTEDCSKVQVIGHDVRKNICFGY